MGQAVNATLLGTVTDTSGAVVAGAKVTATEMKTGVSRSTATNDSGNYAFANLPQVNMKSPPRNRDSRRPCDPEWMWL